MARLARLIAALAGLWLAAAAAPASAQPFADWGAVVIAGDWHAHEGGPTEAFDNARRDVAVALRNAGFRPANIRQFSVRPERYRDTRPGKSSLDDIYDGMMDISEQTTGGCLIYFSSHGDPEGVVVDDQIVRPHLLADMLDRSCGARPTIVVLSACFSGVFVPALARPNRMVLTAARRDRTSFGCGQADRYPFFDDCFLQVMPGAHDFGAVASAVRACVAAREIKENARPPSEPQVWIGAALKPMLPLYAFQPAPPDPR